MTHTSQTPKKHVRHMFSHDTFAVAVSLAIVLKLANGFSSTVTTSVNKSLFRRVHVGTNRVSSSSSYVKLSPINDDYEHVTAEEYDNDDKVINPNTFSDTTTPSTHRRHLLSSCVCCGSTAATAPFLFTPASVSAAEDDANQKKQKPSKKSKTASTTSSPASAALNEYFPSAIPVKSLPDVFRSQLKDYKKDNTLLVTSFSPDEINAPVIDVLSSRFRPPSNIGGLAGIPFSGASALKSAINHVPAGGNLLIVLGPHVGIDDGGYLGFVDREGQRKSTTACGAVVVATKLLQKGYTSWEETEFGGGEVDAQEKYIVEELARRTPSSVWNETDENKLLAFATYQTYCIVRDYFQNALAGITKRPAEITILGGITINRGTTTSKGAKVGGDMFQPLLFQKINANGEINSIYRTAFGEKPFLYPALFRLRSAVTDVLADVDYSPTSPRSPARSHRYYFPTALPIPSLLPLLRNTLPHFTSANTLVATSVCADEINAPLLRNLCDAYDQPFSLGGLAGIPFSGVSGFGACVSHVPEDGNLLVIVASHVGYDGRGRLGKVSRPGQYGSSGACGAAIGALKAVQAGVGGKGKSVLDGVDEQEDYILRELAKRVPAKVLQDNDHETQVAFTTYQTYCIARDYLEKVLAKQKVMPREVAVLGGIIVNRGVDGEDLFQPLLFQTMDGDGSNAKSRYEMTFGAKPYISLFPVLGGLRYVVQDVLEDARLSGVGNA